MIYNIVFSFITMITILYYDVVIILVVDCAIAGVIAYSLKAQNNIH